MGRIDFQVDWRGGNASVFARLELRGFDNLVADFVKVVELLVWFMKKLTPFVWIGFVDADAWSSLCRRLDGGSVGRGWSAIDEL